MSGGLARALRRFGELVGRSATSTRFVVAADPTRALAVITTSVLLGAAPVVIGILTKHLVDALSAGTVDPVSSASLAAALLLVMAVTQLVPSLTAVAESDLGRTLSRLTKERVFSKVIQLGGLRHFERPEFHDDLRLALEAGDHAPTQLLRALTGSVQQTVTLTGFLAALWIIDPIVTVLAVVAAVPHLLVELRLGRARFHLQAELSPVQRRQLFYSSLQTQESAAKEIRLFGLGDHFRRLMLTELATSHRAEARMDRQTARSRMALDLCSLVPVAVALAVIIQSAAAGRVSPGDVVLFLAALTSVVVGSAELAAIVARFEELTLLFERYHRLLRVQPDVVLGEGRVTPPLRSGIELDDVWFRYRDDAPWVLSGVTLRIPAGRAVALVGVNGAGKSTLVKLLCRLYEPTRGTIRWDGVDLRDLEPAALRQRIGSVFQDYVSYDLSARDNIGLGDLEAMHDVDRIRRRAADVGLEDALDGLPRGFDTLLTRLFLDEEVADGDERASGAAGSYLSGGQWQRLAIARMLMRSDRDLLILDEPSAGLDARAEHDVHEIVRVATGGATRLLVSHRLNTVRSADQIVVLQGGRVTEVGTHAELMRRDGLYAELFTMQGAGYRDAESPIGDTAVPEPDGPHRDDVGLGYRPEMA